MCLAYVKLKREQAQAQARQQPKRHVEQASIDTLNEQSDPGVGARLVNIQSSRSLMSCAQAISICCAREAFAARASVRRANKFMVALLSVNYL